MPSYRRSAASLEELREQVLLAFGPEARIVEATRVTRRGVGRWLARDEIEATVEVPEGASPAGGVDASRLDRSGIAALLADADDGDAAGAAGAATAAGGELHLGNLTAHPAAAPPQPRTRHNATPEAPSRPADDAMWRVHELGEREGGGDGGDGGAEPLMPSTAAPAFAALLAAVERSLGVEEPPAPNGPLLALPAEVSASGRAPHADADAADPSSRHLGASAPAPAVEAGASDADRRDDPDAASEAPSRHLGTSAPPPAVEAGAGAANRRGRARAAGGAAEAGDLVLLVGLGDDGVRVARELAGQRGWPVSWVRVTAARSGARPGTRSVSSTSVIADRRAALSARADALRLEREVLLAHVGTLDDTFAQVAALRPDRVWAVVDVSRTPSDTAEWVTRLDETLGVDALAIVGTAFTRDRDAAARLGFPVVWQEPEASA